MTGLVECRALRCQRGDRVIYEGLDLRLESGGALQIVGANGSGKTSLLRQLAGVCAAHPPARVRCAPCVWVGHANALKGGLSAAQNLQWLAALMGAPGDARAAADALARAQIGHLADTPCAALSAGQRRRVALCRLQMGTRRLWLLDEPASGLDEAAQAMLWQWCREHRAAGGGLIISAHKPLWDDQPMLRLP